MYRNVHAVRGTGGEAVLFVHDDLAYPSAWPEPIELPDFKAKPGELREVIIDGHRVILVGMGPHARADAWLPSGAIGRRLRDLNAVEASLIGDGLDYAVIGCALEALTWDPKLYRGSASGEADTEELTIYLPEQEDVEAFEKGQELGRAINACRTLVNTPPNIATTGFIADYAKDLAEECELSYRCIEGEELEELGLEGLINVGKASENEPCLIRLGYEPKGAKGKPIVLVGKTICYDTGGLSLKPREGMAGMKGDKGGGCAVLGAMQAIAKLYKPDRPVIALLCVAENSVSDEAYRPDDVLTFKNGVTVEITNTDAEGRLVLADGLCWAVAEEDPACILDIATLTGGVVTALGKVFAGAFSNDEHVYQVLETASEATDEKIWRLPLHPEYVDLMRSKVADLVNSNPNRQAHPIQGAAFLSQFVPEGTPWAHIDIAGVSSTSKPLGPICEGPTGFGVSLLAEFCGRYTESS